MKRCTLDDLDFVASIIGHESVFPYVSEDGTSASDSKEYARVLLSTEAIYVLSPNVYTIAFFIPQNSICFELHSCVLPEGRGKMALNCAKETADWIFGNTDCQKVITWVPVFNRAATLMARRIGFASQGNNDKSFRKNGVLHDQELFGMTKEKWLCQ